MPPMPPFVLFTARTMVSVSVVALAMSAHSIQ
jgi:hypothetical protein